MNIPLWVFQHAPGPLRTVLASAHGYHLRRWRYGPETSGLVEEALDRETWGPERLRQWQEEHRARILHRAATRVPFYREFWARQRRRGVDGSPERLEDWPVLTKETLRANLRAFVADDVDTRGMYADHTSGTTGTPLTIWLRRNTLLHWYALFEARTRRWHGIGKDEPWGSLGGQPILPPDRRKPPYWVWNRSLRQLYLSAMHVAPWSAADYLAAIDRFELRSLVGYSSSLFFLASEAKTRGLELPSLRAIVTNAEPLYDFQRVAIREGFGCFVQETYGQCEYVCTASQCAEGRLHLWPEVGTLEILDEDGSPCAPGSPGRMVATSIINPDMPLVRYDVRDRGQMVVANAVCACGRTLEALGRVWGRWDDIVVTKDGRLPVLLDRIFDPPAHVKEGQIVQDDVGFFRLRVVPSPGWSAADEELLRKALLALVGEAQVTFEFVDRIERTWAGKFRTIVSHVNDRTGLVR